MYYQQKTMTESEYIEFLKVASGEKKAELVLKNASYLDVFTNCFRKGDIAISHRSFAALPVIPELRITTFGVVNVTKWKIEN